MVNTVRRSLSLDRTMDNLVCRIAADQGRSVSAVTSDLIEIGLFMVGREVITVPPGAPWVDVPTMVPADV